MSWFGRKTAPKNDVRLAKPAVVEIEAQKHAQEEAINKAKKASKDLNELLVVNGFTLKIYLATGGHVKTTRSRK